MEHGFVEGALDSGPVFGVDDFEPAAPQSLLGGEAQDEGELCADEDVAQPALRPEGADGA